MANVVPLRQMHTCVWKTIKFIISTNNEISEIASSEYHSKQVPYLDVYFQNYCYLYTGYRQFGLHIKRNIVINAQQLNQNACVVRVKCDAFNQCIVWFTLSSCHIWIAEVCYAQMSIKIIIPYLWRTLINLCTCTHTFFKVMRTSK